jgi:hypothetical protein
MNGPYFDTDGADTSGYSETEKITYYRRVAMWDLFRFLDDQSLCNSYI